MDDFERTNINTENAKAEQQNLEAALDEEPEFKYSYLGNGYECMLLGVTTVIGGQLYGWNAGFSSGFGSYFIGQVMVGLAYIVLLSCLAEMSGTLAFPGGTYGLARAVLGFFPGFLVGCLECCEYLFMSTASVVYIGQLFVSFTNCDPSMQPALWFIFYGFTILTTCFDARIFWATSTTLAIVCIVLLLIYSLGSLQYVNLAVNGPYFNNTATYVNTSILSHFNLTDNSLLTTRIMHSSGQNYTQILMTPLLPGPTRDPSYWFVGGFNAWLSALQFSTWGFAGIESLTLMTSMTKDPKQAISFGCSYGVIALFCTCILTVVVCGAMPPGLFVTSGLDTFMSVGYMMMFPGLFYVATLAMILPGQIGMAWGFVVPTGKKQYHYLVFFTYDSPLISLIDYPFSPSIRQIVILFGYFEFVAIFFHVTWGEIPEKRHHYWMHCGISHMFDRLFTSYFQCSIATNCDSFIQFMLFRSFMGVLQITYHVWDVTT